MSSVTGNQMFARQRLALVANVAIALAVLAKVAITGLTVNPDTPGYLEHSPIRSWAYPLFIDLTLGHVNLGFTEVAQVVLALGSAWALARTLRRVFEMTPLMYVLSFLLLASQAARVGDVIATECLAFACLLYFFKTLIEVHEDDGPKQIIRFITAAFATVAVRPQFLFLWPIVALVALEAAVSGRCARAARLSVGLIAALLSGQVAQGAYNRYYNGMWTGLRLTGIQLLTGAVYLLPLDDDSLRLDSTAKSFLNVVAAKADQQGLRAKDLPPGFTVNQQFGLVFDKICWLIIVPEFAKTKGKEIVDSDLKLSAADWAEVDGLTMAIAVRLIARHPVDWLIFRIKEVKEFGGYLPLVMIIFLFVMARSAQNIPNRARLAAVAYAAILGLVNYAAVATVQRLGNRYTFYTEILQLPVWMGFVGSLLAGPRRQEEPAHLSSGAAPEVNER